MNWKKISINAIFAFGSAWIASYGVLSQTQLNNFYAVWLALMNAGIIGIIAAALEWSKENELIPPKIAKNLMLF
jgi:hypothetical protein